MLRLTRSIGSPCDQRAQQAAWQLASPASGRSGAGRPRGSGWGPSQEGLPAAGYRTQVTRRPGETARASISMPAGTRGDLFGAADGGSFEGLGLAASLADHLEGSAPSPSPSPSPPLPLPTQTPRQNGCPIGLFAPRGFTGDASCCMHGSGTMHGMDGQSRSRCLLPGAPGSCVLCRTTILH